MNVDAFRISRSNGALDFPSSVEGRTFCACACLALVGLFSFLGGAESPDEAVKRFANFFTNGNAAQLVENIHPDIVEGKEIGEKEVKAFLNRYQSTSMEFRGSELDEQMESEDGKTRRFQATLRFTGPSLSAEYPGPADLRMTLLWVLEDGRWLLERPITIRYLVRSNERYPTDEQNAVAMRFATAVDILGTIGLPGTEDIDLAPMPREGSAADLYKELENLHKRERDPKGIHWNARGVNVLLKAAQMSEGGFLTIYHGDFPASPSDRRRPVPWDILRDYVRAAIKKGRILENRDQVGKAKTIYRRIISLGRQLLDEPGGVQFLTWGMTFQRMGARELARLDGPAEDGSESKAEAFVKLAGRRIDLLRTALACLDDMTDYRSLKAAIDSSRGMGIPQLRPWGINTLVILELKGAPAARKVLKKAAAVVLVMNREMRATAARALDDLATEAGDAEAVRRFIDYQKKWVATHRVYGRAPAFR